MNRNKIKLEVDLSQYDTFGLCYVDRNICYFTSQDIREQWGDDWDDAPYEHNAGTPYLPTIYHQANGEKKLSDKDWHPDGAPRYQLLALHFDSGSDVHVETPCEHYSCGNSPWSVKAINEGACPWLIARAWNTSLKNYEVREVLNAGVSPCELYAFLKRQGASLLIPDSGLAAYPAPMPQTPFYKA